MQMPSPVPDFRRRSLLLGLLAAGGGLAHAAADAPLQLIGEARLPHRMTFAGTTVGGLSAIDYDASTGLYDLLSDDRSDLQPARVYRARIGISANGVSTPELTEVITLKQANGQPWPDRRHAIDGVEVPDPEAFRRLPNGNFLWTSEGDVRRGFGPALRECRADGTQLREFALPAHFAPGPGRGVRDNLAFEGLTLTPDNRQAWVAMENALAQDGPIPTTTAAGGPCRFTLFDIASGRAVRQIAYTPDAIPATPNPAGTYADNGVSEVLMQDARHMLVLERAYINGFGNSLRIYRIDVTDRTYVTDTLALDVLDASNHRPVPKTLVTDFSQLGLSRLDNTEGMTWGPPLADGRRTLVVVSDDNFNPGQITQIAAFAVNP